MKFFNLGPNSIEGRQSPAWDLYRLKAQILMFLVVYNSAAGICRVSWYFEFFHSKTDSNSLRKSIPCELGTNWNFQPATARESSLSSVHWKILKHPESSVLYRFVTIYVFIFPILQFLDFFKILPNNKHSAVIYTGRLG